MKRLLCLCLCLGFMPMIVGCVENANADDTNKPVEKAKADSSSIDASKKPTKTPLTFSDLPADDPLVANAIQAREQISEIEEELLERLDELRSALVSAKADPARLRQSVESFMEMTKEMKQKTTQANEAINAVTEKTSELTRSSRHLASSYRALAELFRKKSRDYSEKKLREQILQFAKDYDTMAEAIPEHVKALDGVQRKLPTLKKKIKEVNAFLNDSVAFLNSHPGVGSDPRERYAGEFESFAVTFSEWIKTLDQLRQVLREQAVSKVIQDGYRKEVIAWQKLEVAKREEEARQERAKAEALAKAEQAKRDEQTRLAKLAEVESQKLVLERERLTQERERLAQERARLTQFEQPMKSPSAQQGIVQSAPYVVPLSGYPTTTYYVSSCPQPVTYRVSGSQTATYCNSPCVQPVTYQVVRPCRCRLFSLFRRG